MQFRYMIQVHGIFDMRHDSGHAAYLFTEILSEGDRVGMSTPCVGTKVTLHIPRY